MTMLANQSDLGRESTVLNAILSPDLKRRPAVQSVDYKIWAAAGLAIRQFIADYAGESIVKIGKYFDNTVDGSIPVSGGNLELFPSHSVSLA